MGNREIHTITTGRVQSWSHLDTESQKGSIKQDQGNPGTLPGGGVFHLSLVEETGMIKEVFR